MPRFRHTAAISARHVRGISDGRAWPFAHGMLGDDQVARSNSNLLFWHAMSTVWLACSGCNV